MTRDKVIARLRAHESELKAAGILRLQLFGSVARGDHGSQSDVDLVAALDDSRGLSLIDFVHLENRLSDLLGVKVDPVQARTLKPRVRINVEREARACLLEILFSLCRTSSITLIGSSGLSRAKARSTLRRTSRRCSPHSTRSRSSARRSGPAMERKRYVPASHGATSG